MTFLDVNSSFFLATTVLIITISMILVGIDYFCSCLFSRGCTWLLVHLCTVWCYTLLNEHQKIVQNNQYCVFPLGRNNFRYKEFVCGHY